VGEDDPSDGGAPSRSDGSNGSAAKYIPEAGLGDAGAGRAGSGGAAGGGVSGAGAAASSGGGGASGAGGEAGTGSGGAAGEAGGGGQSAQGIGRCPADAAAHVLFVFDVSASMEEAFDDTSRIDAATAAVASALAAYDPALRVGALFFPTAACIPFQPPPPGGSVASLSAAPQLAFQSAEQFRQLWPDVVPFDVTIPGGTPLQEALDRADEALATLGASEPAGARRGMGRRQHAAMGGRARTNCRRQREHWRDRHGGRYAARHARDQAGARRRAVDGDRHGGLPLSLS
jgi:hypothetical protein